MVRLIDKIVALAMKTSKPIISSSVSNNKKVFPTSTDLCDDAILQQREQDILQEKPKIAQHDDIMQWIKTLPVVFATEYDPTTPQIDGETVTELQQMQQFHENSVACNEVLPPSDPTNYVMIQSINRQTNHPEQNSESSIILAHNENSLENQFELSADPPEIIDNLIEDAPENENFFTTEGNPRKRRKYNVNLETRKQQRSTENVLISIKELLLRLLDPERLLQSNTSIEL
ncbi:hypothetical protein FQR65_LT05636 [Abscondita terminalis]|nr:hypothetical protein FQR65_LT05636 [Abscondita terminalis]